MKRPSPGFLIVMAILLVIIGFVGGAGLVSSAGNRTALSNRRYFAVGNIYALGNSIELLETGKHAEALPILRDAFLDSYNEFDLVQSYLNNTDYYSAQVAAFQPLRERLRQQPTESRRQR